jgi:DNA helicase II / ATP-dependent DNA helicase PcrA
LPITDTQTEAPLVSNDEDGEDSEAPRDEQIAAWTAVLTVSFSQIEACAAYLMGSSAYDTHQGVKGLEFKRVMVIIDDDDARGFMFSYDKLLGVRAKSDSDRKNENSGGETTLDRTRRLLYVICSRAEESLAVVAYTGNPAQVVNAFVSQGLFDASEIETIPA